MTKNATLNGLKIAITIFLAIDIVLFIYYYLCIFKKWTRTISMELSAKKLNQYSEAMSAMIADYEVQSPVELKKMKSPRLEMMLAFKDHILKMVSACFPIGLQLRIMAESIPGFRVTPDTYRLHLETVVGVEAYRIYKVNSYLLGRPRQLRGLIERFDDVEEQYQAFENKEYHSYKNKLIVSVSLEDFKAFMLLYKEDIVNGFDYVITKPLEHVFVTPTAIVEKEVVKEEVLIINEPIDKGIPTEKEKIVEVKGQKIDVNNLQFYRDPNRVIPVGKERFKYEDVCPRFGLLEGIVLDDTALKNIPDRFPIIEDIFDFPYDKTLPYTYDTKTNGTQIDGVFCFFSDFRLFNASNYVPEDNEIMIFGKNYESPSGLNYYVFRFYKGVLCKMYDFRPHTIINCNNEFIDWFDYNADRDFNNFSREFYDVCNG
ncbi:hypothetical protein JHD48_07960 [Sulfurimonas sp. SAG-AH-194-I05]|nr:hypothetical protein [Sulfurimonas sp. SAG-AH-194-I05]MDF1875666.1 hypothetical protein [Sulfurimonas sp. SAG-AH-194-I05]